MDKLVINETQWRLFEEAGADMSQYVLNEPLPESFDSTDSNGEKHG